MPIKQKSDDIVSRWERAKATLDAAKKLEMGLREEIVQEHFKSNDVGTFHFDVPDGRDLVCVKKLSYRLDRDGAWAAQDQLRPMLGAEIAARLIKWSPELSLTEYKLLPAEARSILEPAMTIKPATPTLALKVKK